MINSMKFAGGGGLFTNKKNSIQSSYISKKGGDKHLDLSCDNYAC